MFSQLVEERSLAPLNPPFRFLDAEPGSAIDLGKALALARSWRPFDFEFIAFQPGFVNVAFDRPGMDHFAARLQPWSQRDERAVHACAYLLGEFAPRSRKPILSAIKLAFRDCPGSEVLFRPERPAGMDEKELKRTSLSPVDQQARALLRHGAYCSARPPRTRPT